jgi:hypothetical protein
MVTYLLPILFLGELYYINEGQWHMVYHLLTTYNKQCKQQGQPNRGRKGVFLV